MTEKIQVLAPCRWEVGAKPLCELDGGRLSPVEDNCQLGSSREQFFNEIDFLARTHRDLSSLVYDYVDNRCARWVVSHLTTHLAADSIVDFAVKQPEISRVVCPRQLQFVDVVGV